MIVSDCCGHPVIDNSDDYGICPDCKEHCEYVEEEEEEPKTVKATFKGVGFNMPLDTAKKVLNLQRIIKEQRELNKKDKPL